MADISEMIAVVANERGWYGAQAPAAFQYFTLNVQTLRTVTEAQYEKDFPAWTEQIKKDYDEIIVKRENDRKVLEAAQLVERAGVKRMSELTEAQFAKLLTLLNEEPKEPVTAA
jgi:hypothetical protein